MGEETNFSVWHTRPSVIDLRVTLKKQLQDVFGEVTLVLAQPC